jgi:hypothetical protein
MKMFVHMLNDDSLLDIFHFCRPVMIDEVESSVTRILRGGIWDREHWWYKLTHVCRRWRCLVLASASHLNLSLLCRRGLPVADILTCSPPLPLIIDHIHDNIYDSISAEDKAGIMLALQHRDRVRRIRLKMPLSILQELVLAMDGEFPMLEYLYITPSECNSWFILLDTFQAPRLRHLILTDFALPITSPLIETNSTGLVTLWLQHFPQSAYLHPNDLLQQISLMPQLETLGISFHSTVPNRDLERQLMHRPVTTRITLPNLRWLELQAASTYVDALLPRMVTPMLERLETLFFFQLNVSIPHLPEFIAAAENLRLVKALFEFSDRRLDFYVYPRDDAPMYSFHTGITCRHTDWQVSFAAQIFRTLKTSFSTVELITLAFLSYPESPDANEIDLTQWRKLLRSFSDVKTLRVGDDFHGQISRSLQVDDGESSLEFLPELKELHYPVYPRSYSDSNAFEAFIDARQNAGRPVTLVRYY